jgi:hypothetical protein
VKILELFQDYHVQYWTSGKNVQAGWVNVRCPFCHDTSNHLGFNLNREYFNCWKCGKKPMKSALSRVLAVPESKVIPILRQYDYQGHSTTRKAEPAQIGSRKFKLPIGTGPIEAPHKRYLRKRGFDPNQIAEDWGILGTGPNGLLDGISYKYRIIVPIIWDGRIVSFQARDYTNRQMIRYRTCSKEREIIHHKHILYGNQEKWNPEFGICVEGVTDVWRMGPESFATFGTEYKPQQVRQMKFFKRIVVLFDYEDMAQARAERLVSTLRSLRIEAWSANIPDLIQRKTDPGGLINLEAQLIIRKLKRRYLYV